MALEKQVGGDHYKNFAIQPIEFCQRNNLGFCESLAIKYLTRYKSKNGLEDLQKAIHCIELLIEMTYLTQEDVSIIQDQSVVTIKLNSNICPSCGKEFISPDAAREIILCAKCDLLLRNIEDEYKAQK